MRGNFVAKHGLRIHKHKRHEDTYLKEFDKVVMREVLDILNNPSDSLRSDDSRINALMYAEVKGGAV